MDLYILSVSTLATFQLVTIVGVDYIYAYARHANYAYKTPNRAHSKFQPELTFMCRKSLQCK